MRNIQKFLFFVAVIVTCYAAFLMQQDLKKSNIVLKIDLCDNCDPLVTLNKSLPSNTQIVQVKEFDKNGNIVSAIVRTSLGKEKLIQTLMKSKDIEFVR